MPSEKIQHQVIHVNLDAGIQPEALANALAEVMNNTVNKANDMFYTACVRSVTPWRDGFLIVIERRPHRG
jgi:hypothetical protein